MAGPLYLATVKNGSGTVVQDSVLRVRSRETPTIKYATLTKQGDITNVSLGNFITYNGWGIDQISDNYVHYATLTPDSVIFDQVNGVNITEKTSFCMYQPLQWSSSQFMYGNTYFIEYEKFKILGFIDPSDAPNYVLRDTITASSSSGSVDISIEDNKIKILTGNFPNIPQQEAPADFYFVFDLDLSEDDYLTAFGQNVDPQQDPSWGGFGYVFYDSVLVQSGFTVTFDSQGGSSVEPITNVESGSTIEEPEPPTREHYNFRGWFKEPECLNIWEFDYDTVTEDITLYAKWAIQTFTVTFNSEGGTQVSPYTSVEYGSTISEPSTPEKLEKDFGGWFKDEEYETEWDFENDVVTDDITLYAKWIDWRTSRISNPNAFSGMPLTLTRGKKVRREFRPFR